MRNEKYGDDDNLPPPAPCDNSIGLPYEGDAESDARLSVDPTSMPVPAKEISTRLPYKDKVDNVGPEELVRRETKVVNFLRALLLVVQVIVAAFLSFGIYKLSRKWEEEAFHKDFDVISSRFTVAFTSELSHLFLNAYAFGVTISSSSNLVAAAPNITIPLDKLAAGAVESTRFFRAFWSPLISNTTQRNEWEAYAQDQMKSLNGNTNHHQCFPCGSPDLEIGAPNEAVALPIGTYTCSNIQWGAEQGLASPSDCQALIPYVQAACQCRPVTGESGYTNKTQPEARSDRIFQVGHGEITPVTGHGPFSPVWQVFPSPDWASIALFDLFSAPVSREALGAMIETQKAVISKTFFTKAQSLWNKLLPDKDWKAISLLFSPVINTQVNSSQILGSIVFEIDWTYILADSVPLGSNGIHIILENSCGQQHTFKSTKDLVQYLGDGDLHDPAYSSMVVRSTFEDYTKVQNFASPVETGRSSQRECGYRISIYPSEEFRSNYFTSKPRIYAITVILIFVFTSTVFVIYDCYVSRRQRMVMRAALERDEIVSNLFPAAVRERLFQVSSRPNEKTDKVSTVINPKVRFRNLRRSISTPSSINAAQIIPRSDPIADFFPNVTIVFADISGFTAWSSEREPSQVFQLLETVYQAFDKLAHQFGVFKVETIGDCYVAAAGVPLYQPDHAVRIVKFAHECLIHMHKLTHELEATLGPSTSNLSIRIGVHSGPVIAGVLRGEKSRFQLFGDTMNTAARMQTTGEINMIQISNATARILEEADKSNWIQQRDEPISLKGKGLVQTYWADPLLPFEDESYDIQSVHSSHDAMTSEVQESRPWGDVTHARLSNKVPADEKLKKMVAWNTDLLLRQLQKVVAMRKVTLRSRKTRPKLHLHETIDGTPLENVTEIIPMHDFVEKVARAEVDLVSVDLGDTVRSQLFDYIYKVALLYRHNPFHNFEHASHVAMSAAKVVARIIKPDLEYTNASVANSKGRVALKRAIHNSTFGISSDVLMQFAAVFSAIIHDVDHPGVSNAQLVEEAQAVALRYSNKCVAEQNSVDIAWSLLMQEEYKDLRFCIFTTEEEQLRFRQLLVNAVIATDIADKELQQRRKNRWDKAFHYGSDLSSDISEYQNDFDRKATIVFEYIIQASDVAHTMQHWNVYKQWNERLFEERYRAYQQGREPTDPSVCWYRGEIWFFDNYIIPLAKKLETCGVFGVSSDEYLSYALENRHEWEIKGEDIVRVMLEKYRKSCCESAGEVTGQTLCSYAPEA